MKISDLIYELAQRMHYHGDLPVVIGTDEDGEYHDFTIGLMIGHPTLDGRYASSDASEKQFVKLTME